MPAAGALPANIHCAHDYEDLARQALEPAVFAHLAGGAGRDVAVRNNRAAFEALKITPRVLRDLKAGSTRLSLGGEARPHPIWLGPVAFQALFHAGAEVETARAAAAVGAGLVASTLSSVTLEEIAAAAGPDRWFQLYVQPAREATLDLVRRAEAAGYRALVVTVDAPVHAPGLTSLRAGFRGGQASANLAGWTAPEAAPAPGESRVFQGLMPAAPTWADIDWLRAQTALPLWLKGVMHPDDARAALAAGVDGLVVSNHGGRELDSAPSSLSALPPVRAAVGESFPLLFDGGIRCGEDVFKAIALGADGVMLGRLQAWALAAAGALGVGHMIKLLREELEVCMALAGCVDLADIRRAEVRAETWAGKEGPC
ncbi:alpha-hydroxy acid oxidase [Phenylobacterium sp.]|jgi:isopentenyl diphosphate isomerase/L-lactate dehydrogenase-like FMN-dependent dehydrogenase|uniref:alpha-hydroxy acid oxidase n=1 Tax=Phenylobacterium sp. TaxID=1871053 RepID=UPI002E360F03|nr:alpha-hydroxy acid oxidase [Phenylobacterium sp.]HEX2561341.1 alpha-hydroxy acid oxidase [Phenylobacterium sp.]